MDPQDRKDWIRGLALLAWISGEVLGLTVFGLLAGYWACRWLGLASVWMILPAALGLAAAFWRLHRAVGALGPGEEKKETKSSSYRSPGGQDG